MESKKNWFNLQHHVCVVPECETPMVIKNVGEECPACYFFITHARRTQILEDMAKFKKKARNAKVKKYYRTPKAD